jgi:hypothetical protein
MKKFIFMVLATVLVFSSGFANIEQSLDKTLYCQYGDFNGRGESIGTLRIKGTNPYCGSSSAFRVARMIWNEQQKQK